MHFKLRLFRTVTIHYQAITMAKKDSYQKSLTIKDIARIANVSPATVSLVINGQPGVSSETRDRLSVIVQALNYQPNLVARSLVKRRSYAIAMLITNTRNPIFPEIAAGVDDVLNEFGYSLSIISTYDDEKMEANRIEKIRARGIDGIIASAALIEDENIRNLVQSGYPVVSVLRRAYNCPELDYVNVDNVKGGYLAVEHLIRLGHKRIGIIKGPLNTSTGVERLKGALQAFKAYGVTLFEELVAQGDYFKESGYQATSKFLRLGKKRRPTALFVCNDDMALGALEAVLDEGLRMPDDIALVGFNNMEATALRSIEITTISQHKHEMGKLAAKRLIDKIEKNDGYRKPYQVVLEPTLMIRGSCGYRLSSKYLLRKRRIRHS
jgi:LacI family transcriptional regulator